MLGCGVYSPQSIKGVQLQVSGMQVCGVCLDLFVRVAVFAAVYYTKQLQAWLEHGPSSNMDSCSEQLSSSVKQQHKCFQEHTSPAVFASSCRWSCSSRCPTACCRISCVSFQHCGLSSPWLWQSSIARPLECLWHELGCQVVRRGAPRPVSTGSCRASGKSTLHALWAFGCAGV